MADVMVVEFLLNKLSEVRQWYGDLITGAENELNELSNELGQCKSFLADSQNKQKKEELFKEIKRQIRDVVHDAEDTIDTYLTEARAEEKQTFIGFKRKAAKKADISLPLQLKSLRTDKMLPVLTSIERYAKLQISVAGIEEGTAKELKLPRLTKDNLNDEVLKITNYILQPKDELDVISIIGMPGKTWKKIYESPKIRFNYPVRIWVHVSQILNKRDVLLTILEEFTRQDMSVWNDDYLALEVRKRLDECKYLLFLVDVWSLEVWDIIRDVLPVRNKEGKVVITSRGNPITICPQRLKDYDIAKKCTVHIVDNTNINMNEEIVEMSYKRLPDHLRDCFLYLGVFPENYEIPARTLTHLWIAEGFIKTEGKSLERTAEGNLRELVDRNLVMVEKFNPSGKVKSCRVHDVVRALCITKATKDQELYQEIVKSKEGTFQPSVSDIPKHRRICIHSHLQEILDRRQKGPRVRSLLSFNEDPVDLDSMYTPVIPGSFNLLRVLDSTSVKFNRFPEGLTRLMHLRYIALSGKEIESLPKAISNLWNLQTLVVNTNSDFLLVEANIWMMSQLRHVITRAAIVLVINGTTGTAGENLRTMSRLSPGCCTDDVFKKACNLSKLGVRGKLATLFDGSKTLKELGCLNDMDLKNQVRVFPSVEFFPSSLKRLTIVHARLDWKHMSTLAGINSLEVLKLKQNAFFGECWKGVGMGFPSLHYLFIQDMDFAVWEVTPDYFQKLKTLVLKNCHNLIDIPEGLTGNLEVLDIGGVRATVLNSAKEIKKRKEAESENTLKLILPSYI